MTREVSTYKSFKDLSFYQGNENEYELFPFNFTHVDNNEYLLVNETGEFVFLNRSDLKKLSNHSLHFEDNESLFLELINKQFIYFKNDKEAITRKAIKYRTKKQFLYSGPVLHVFVVTTRCQHKCQYCQITPQSEKAIEYDMTSEIARKSVEMMMEAPADSITVEFQGGETLLAFDIVKEIVLYTKELNENVGKDLEFVLATSLVDITLEQLTFVKEHNINLSTSLDGPEELHNKNRPIHSQNTYKKFIEGYELSTSIVGADRVSPLLTLSRDSLENIDGIIEEYQNVGQNSISLRALSPYGFAVKTQSRIGYSSEKYIDFYLKALDKIIDMNLNGIYFREEYATLLLRRIFTPYSTGYVDLQSPSGAGINAMVYYYNGDVYPADEARMLAEMGDKNFCLGSVLEDSYSDIFNSKPLEVLVQDSCAESLAGCSDCAYLPYCGCDPLFNYVTQGDHYGNRPTSDFCHKQTAIYEYLFNFIKNKDEKVLDVFWSWMNFDPELTGARMEGEGVC